MFFKFFGLFSLLICAYTQSQGCQNTLQRIKRDILSNNTNKLLREISPFGQLSGDGPNRWGDYDACNRDPKKRYVVLSITNSSVGTQNMGICISSQCSANDLQFETPIIKQLIQNQFAVIDLTYSIVSIKDPLTIYPQKNFSFYVTILYLLILLSFTLIHPFSQFIQAIKQIQEGRRQGKNILTLNDDSLSKSASLSYQNNESASTLVRSPQGNEDLELAKEQYHSQKVNIEEENEQSFLEQISIIESYNQLFTLNTPDPNLSIFNGFRSIALVMVVFGHQYFISFALTDQQEVGIQLKRWMGLLLFDCQYAVDVFFWIGGFFLGFIMVEVKKRTLIQKQGYKGILLVILHRVLRIWPCYLTTLLILSNLTPFLGEGPRWFQINGIDDCSTWWRNALFIDNLFDDNKYCMGWAWYLSNDFQLFLVSLIPIYIYAKYQPKLAKYSIIALIVITQLCGILISNRDNSLYFYSLGSASFFKSYYTKPWCRGSPYFLGLLFGIMYREYKTQNKQILDQQGSIFSPSKSQEDKKDFTAIQSLKNWYHQDIKRQIIVVSSLYIIGFGLISLLSFGWRSYQVNGQDYWPRGFSILWQGFCKLFYCFGLTLLTLVCCLGQKDYFNDQIMNCLLFRFLSKISFTCYMIHYIVITVTMSNFYEHPELTFISQLQFFTGNFLITMFFATLMTLIVELPFAKLEQLLSAKLSPKNKLVDTIKQKLIS